MIQCGDVEQNPGPVLKYAECVKTVGASFKNNVKNLSLHDKTSGGGLPLYIPRSFKPKERSDLTNVSESRFESI